MPKLLEFIPVEQTEKKRKSIFGQRYLFLIMPCLQRSIRLNKVRIIYFFFPCFVVSVAVVNDVVFGM